ncbi:MAG TPA: hypothetical protein VLG69_01445 [Candidatus Andersenbacteria bacterium]|nr:hypothetical protein [Candidatus Andersenbacteria bacterium]
MANSIRQLFRTEDSSKATFPRPVSVESGIPTHCIDNLLEAIVTRMAGRRTRNGKYHAATRIIDVFHLLTHGSMDWRTRIAGGWTCLIEAGSASADEVGEYMDPLALDLTQICVLKATKNAYDEMLCQVPLIKDLAMRLLATEIRVAMAIADLLCINAEEDPVHAFWNIQRWLLVGSQCLLEDHPLLKRLEQDVKTIRPRFQN